MKKEKLTINKQILLKLENIAIALEKTTEPHKI